MTLLGAPGSGKGFYGNFLAEAWKVPLYSASRILRQSSIVADLDSGNLVDCETVSTTLLSFLQEQHAASTHFLMDGFPRTRQQIDLMNAQWPADYQITTAFHLNVPDAVCAQKIAGRRVCSICHQEPNSADVHIAGFVLPPSIPAKCQNKCNPVTDWKRRPDDECDTIIARRLADYRRHEQPITDYYTSTHALCSFTPYYGVKDVPKLQQTLEDWFMARTMTNSETE
jgi:adenylate kinase